MHKVCTYSEIFFVDFKKLRWFCKKKLLMIFQFFSLYFECLGLISAEMHSFCSSYFFMVQQAKYYTSSTPVSDECKIQALCTMLVKTNQVWKKENHFGRVGSEQFQFQFRHIQLNKNLNLPSQHITIIKLNLDHLLYHSYQELYNSFLQNFMKFRTQTQKWNFQICSADDNSTQKPNCFLTIEIKIHFIFANFHGEF